MKIVKYLIFAAIIFTLWVSKPIWMPKTNYHRSAETTNVDEFVNTQKEERNKLLKAQDKELALLEEKFGPKSAVMPTLNKYFRQTYSSEDKFELLPCSRVIAIEEGWNTVCGYRLKGVIDQDTYTINHGKVTVK